ncbi:MAG: ATP-binding cassette domain-containing protein [Chitinivibrionales bacterium]|nr:ATP-binding cassette domain-containing protein [Chitinivibrionales bacterium]
MLKPVQEKPRTQYKGKLYARMLGYVKPYFPLLAISIILSLFVVAAEAISVWVMASLLKEIFISEVKEIARPEFSLNNLNQILKYWVYLFTRDENPVARLSKVCLIIIVSYSTKNVFSYTKSLIMGIVNLNVVKDLRNSTYNHALTLPITYFDRNKSGETLSIILNDVAKVNTALANTFNRLITEPLRLITFWGLLFVISAKLTMVVFLVYPLLGYAIAQIGKTVRRRSKRVMEYLAGLVSVLHETVNGVRAVKMFNMNEVESRKFASENEKVTRSMFKNMWISSLNSPLIELLGIIVATSLLWYGGKEVLSPNSSLGAEDFVRFIILLMISYQPIKALGGINNAIQGGMAGAERVFGIIDTESEPLLSFRPEHVPHFNRTIAFSNVCFTYPQTEEEVLHDMSFTVDKGEIVALVGSSGAGKSTILDLLPRFYDVSQGSIVVDGHNIADCDLVGLRHLFGIVAQKTILFNDTVYNNIAYGVEHAHAQEVVAAAQAANALEFIEKLPRKMDTLIGENGIMLSGGQCQRLSIARALLKNPPILILDEATSSLDTESERLVQAAINKLMQNRTVLVVAHRLSTVRHADKIIVLEDGEIIEQGTHDELLRLNNRYKYFYDIQFSRPEG